MLSYFKTIVVFCMCVSLSACMSTTENKVDFSYAISAASDINPDIEGKPSSVIVRVYQLSNKINFENATYDALFESDHNALGTEFITLNEYLVDPDTKSTIDLKISKNAKYIGIVVGYRSIDMVTWRTVMEVPEGSFWKSSGLEVKVEKLSVRVIKI